MRIIDADELENALEDSCDTETAAYYFVEFMNYVDEQPTIKAIPVETCKQVKDEILFRMEEFINEYKCISQSSIDYFGGKAEAMDTAKRLVNAVLTELCNNI